jgi:2'-5' RNA ligase
MGLERLEQNPEIRFGWYLRPSYAMCRAQAEMHDLLRRQFGLVAGGAFMPHATVKGFFRSDAPLVDITAAFDRAVVGHEPFTVYNKGPISYGPRSIVLNVHEDDDGEENAALQAIHESAWREIAPLVHPECTFTPVEGAMERFHAHLTLAMADLPPALHEEVCDFIGAAGPIGPRTFTAEYFHLFAFHSAAWSGRWWETLTWRLVASWRLGHAGHASAI